MQSTVFWPVHDYRTGFCYGWAEPVICIAGVLHLDQENEAQQSLSVLRDAIQWRSVAQSCGGDPCILGKCTGWVRGAPTLELVVKIAQNFTVIFYHRHPSISLRFYSLDTCLPNHVHDERSGRAYTEIAKYDFTNRPKVNVERGLNHVAINQFNAAGLLETLLQHTSTPTTNSSLVPVTASILLAIGAIGTRLVHPITRLLRGFVAQWPVIHVEIVLVRSAVRLLKDASATVQQLDLRAEQASFLAVEVDTLRRRGTSDISSYSTRYTHFFNTVWLLVNDLSLGHAFGTFLCANHKPLARLLYTTATRWLIENVRASLVWLDSWPAGLKLNTELSAFFAGALDDLVSAWGAVLTFLAPYLPTLVYTIGITSSVMGLTMATSLVMDALALATLHVAVAAAVLGAMYRRMLLGSGALWRLFRGKRYNALRQRLDSWAYDIDELLFGTILFVLLAFLFPTVLVYYTLFALLRLGTLILQAAMETLLAFMNHFPLFALMLRVKDPWRLPGGVYIFPTLSNESSFPLLVLKNQPVPLSGIFFQYSKLWTELSRHYNPLRLLYQVLSGQYLAAIPKYSIRYGKVERASG